MEKTNQPRKQKLRKSTQNGSFVPEKIVKQYQELPIFKGCNLHYDDAKALAILAKKLKEKDPYIAPETILQNQLELYMLIQEKIKELSSDLGSHNEEIKNKAKNDLFKFRTLTINNFVKNPLKNYFDASIEEFFDYIQDFSLKIPRDLNQKKYQKMINDAAKKHKLKQEKTDDLIYVRPFDVDIPTDDSAFMGKFKRFVLNINLESSEVFDALSEFARKHKSYYLVNRQFSDNYTDLESVVMCTYNNDENLDTQQQELAEIAKKFCRAKAEDKIIAKKLSDGLFVDYSEQTPEDVENLVMKTTQLLGMRSPMADHLKNLKNGMEENGFDTEDFVMCARFVFSAKKIADFFEKQDNSREQEAFKAYHNKNDQEKLEKENISVSQENPDDKPVKTEENHQNTEPDPLQPEALDDDKKSEKKEETKINKQNTSPVVVKDNSQDDEKKEKTEKKDTDKSKHESVNDDFKTSWREFADNVATKLKGKVIEEQEAKDFVAKVEHAEGQVSIRASSLNEISIGAKDKENKETTPDMVVFKELVEKSAREGRGINFGNIRDNEFKARLLIVCIEKNVSMKGEPKITDEFLKSLDEKTAKQLIILQNKAQMENSDVQRRISDAKSRIKSAESPGETSNNVASTGYRSYLQE